MAEEIGREYRKEQLDRASRGHDTLAVLNKDPSKAYRWIRRQDMNVAQQQYKGWDPVRGGKERSVLQPDSGAQRKGTDVDSTIVVGDLMLASMPIERAEQLRKDNQDLINRRTRGVAQSFKGNARDPHTGESLGFEDHKEGGNYVESVTADQFDKLTKEK